MRIVFRKKASKCFTLDMLCWVERKYFAFVSKIFFLVFKLKSTNSLQGYMLHCCLRPVANALARKESRVGRSPGTSVQKTPPGPF